ncbi:hypothetical protein [Streptomyces pseudogriseolus]|uniref:hypothetical protein n=1 Tax=Streptomyces pseudogriseolus TaxID=36817 RepID=UPI003FA2979F
MRKHPLMLTASQIDHPAVRVKTPLVWLLGQILSTSRYPLHVRTSLLLPLLAIKGAQCPT